MVYNVKIVYTGTTVDKIPFVNPISRMYAPNNSYIDSPAYKDTVYDTNVEGIGKIDLMEPFASTSFPYPVPLSQFKLATVGRKDIKTGGKKVEFRVPTYMEAYWYQEAGVQLADQGFIVEISPMTEEEAAKKDLSQRMENEVSTPAPASTLNDWLKDKTVSDLQENINIEWNGNVGDVTGTLHYINNFNEYSSNASGTFFCVHLDDSFRTDSGKMKLKGSSDLDKECDFDPDIVYKVEETTKATKPLKVTIDDKLIAEFRFDNIELENAVEPSENQ